MSVYSVFTTHIRTHEWVGVFARARHVEKNALALACESDEYDIRERYGRHVEIGECLSVESDACNPRAPHAPRLNVQRIPVVAMRF